MALNSGLEFSRGLIQSFLQAKQFELYERREKRYSDQLSANRLYQRQQLASVERRFESSQAFAREGREDVQRRFEAGQELTREGMGSLEKRFVAGQELTREQMASLQGRFETTQSFREEQARETKIYRERTGKRLEDLAESLIESRGRPKVGVKQYYLDQGYSEEKAQLAQDRYNRLAPSITTPYQRVTAGKMMMENATTTDMFNAGKQIMQDAMKELQGQNSAFPSRSGGIGPEGTTQLETPSPISSGVFQPRTPDTGATILGGTATQDFLPPESNFGVFDRVNQLDQRIEVRDKDGNLFTIPKSQLEQALTEGFELVEK